MLLTFAFQNLIKIIPLATFRNKTKIKVKEWLRMEDIAPKNYL
jgi:hypothetical protein